MTHKISLVERFGYGSGDMAANFLWHTWNLFLLKFYVDVFGLDPIDAATMYGVTRLFDLITDPLMGIFADKTRSRWGRYRPWIIIGAIPLAITGYLMFVVPDWGSDSKLVYAWVSYSLAMLMYTMIQIPYSALMGVMTPDAKERTTLSSFRFFMAFTGQLIVGVVTLPLITYFGNDGGDSINEAKGYATTMGVYMIFATGLYVYTFMSTRERVAEEANPTADQDLIGNLRALVTNVGWVILLISALFNLIHVAVRNGALLFYFDYYVGDEGKAGLFFGVGTISFMVGIVGANIVVRFMSKRTLLVLLTCIVAVNMGWFYFIPAGNYNLMLFNNVLTSLFAGPIPVILYVLYAEVADYTEWKTGRKVMALVYSTMQIAIKGGLVIGGILSGVLLGMSGYVANSQQTPEAVEAIVLLVSAIPACFAMLSGLVILFYPFDEKVMKKVEDDLAIQRSSQGNGHEIVDQTVDA